LVQYIFQLLFINNPAPGRTKFFEILKVFFSYTVNRVMRYERLTTETFKRSWNTNCGANRLQHSGIQHSASACRSGNGLHKKQHVSKHSVCTDSHKYT